MFEMLRVRHCSCQRVRMMKWFVTSHLNYRMRAPEEGSHLQAAVTIHQPIMRPSSTAAPGSVISYPGHLSSATVQMSLIGTKNFIIQEQ